MGAMLARTVKSQQLSWQRTSAHGYKCASILLPEGPYAVVDFRGNALEQERTIDPGG